MWRRGTKGHSWEILLPPVTLQDKYIDQPEVYRLEGEKVHYLYFAVRKDWPVLVDINKALADISVEEKRHNIKMDRF